MIQCLKSTKYLFATECLQTASMSLAYSPFVWVTSEKLSQCIVWMECDKMASKQSKAENVCKISKFFRAARLKTQCMW